MFMTPEDLSSLVSGSNSHLIAYLPLSAIHLAAPPDGYPCIGDFVTTTVSYIFSGCRLHREPLDVVHASSDGSTTFTLKKGFTRLKLG